MQWFYKFLECFLLILQTYFKSVSFALLYRIILVYEH